MRRKRSILALAEDPRRNLLLFGTGGGRIGAVDLETGSERTLLEIPGEMAVDGMGLSTNGTALYTSLGPDTILTLERKPPKPTQFLVWDYTEIAG
jgi:hypothetical protein